MVPVTAHLIVSLSGLSDDVPAALDAAADFAARLDARGVPLSQLVRPRGPAGVPSPDSRLVRWLHERRETGDAIVLHGYDHHRSPAATRRLRGRRAEFAVLPRHEAGLRLIAARRALTEFSLRTDVFVPPRWLASHGTVEALREQGFRVLADENGIRFLRLPAAEGLRSRVLTFRAAGERDPAVGEAWRCRVLVAEVARTARRGGLVRINVRAKDLRRPAAPGRRARGRGYRAGRRGRSRDVPDARPAGPGRLTSGRPGGIRENPAALIGRVGSSRKDLPCRTWATPGTSRRTRSHAVGAACATRWARSSPGRR